MEILNSTIYDLVMDCGEKSNESIKLCFPFIKYNIIKEIYDRKNNDSDIKLVTNFIL